MQVVPLIATPSQTLQTNVDNQAVTINVYQKQFCMFMDLYYTGSDDEIVVGVQCQNLNRIVRNSYFGFDGDFVFRDTQGDADPYYDGLGTRWRLLYLTPEELASVGLTG